MNARDGFERPTTPGFDRHLDIRFTVTRSGKRVAHYFRPFRWLPLPVRAAELFIAQGLATEIRKGGAS